MPQRERMRSGNNLGDHSAPVIRCSRFWLPRGTVPNLADDGFLVDPQLYSILAPNPPVPLDVLDDIPVLGLLGEPGMGKTTALNLETERLKAATRGTGNRVLRVDLAGYASDVLVDRAICRSKHFIAWERSEHHLHLLLDGFDTCLQHVEPLVGLLLNRLDKAPRDRLSLRIACRTADWPEDLEAGLRQLWRHTPSAEKIRPIEVFELMPFRRSDARAIAEAGGVNGEAFLKEVRRVGAEQFANRPITLRFLLNAFLKGSGLPSRKTDLYREGCLVLCDEAREDLRRGRYSQKLSPGLRFAVAGRLAAVSVFSDRTALWLAPRNITMPDGDVRADELLGGGERFGREVTPEVSRNAIRETLDTGLFRSIGPHRLGFSHQTYAEYLAAQYLVDHNLADTEILKLVLHSDGSNRVVPQLRETAGWLAELSPHVRSVLLAGDPAALLVSDAPPTSDDERRQLVRQILQLYDSGELLDIRIVVEAGTQQEGARLKYAGISGDLKPYVVDKSRSTVVRRVAILMAQFTGQVDLQADLVRLTLDSEESHDLRVAAAVAVRTIGGEASKGALKPLVTIGSAEDPDDELKGAGLAATWPKHLEPNELLAALTPPQSSNLTGGYQQFLWGDFATQIPLAEIIPALEWAGTHVTKPDSEHKPIGVAALSVVIVAIGCFREPGICELLARLLVQIATIPTPALRLMTKLSSHREARVAIARIATQLSPDVWTLRALISYGLVDEGDVPDLFSELANAPGGLAQENIAFLIAELTVGSKRVDAELRDQVLAKAETNATLDGALKWVWDRQQQVERQIEEDKARRKPAERPRPALPAPILEDLLAMVAGADARVFEEICYRLIGDTYWHPDDQVLPGWETQSPATQTQITRAAEIYLTDYCVANTSWMDAGEVWPAVTCGYFALRLLAQISPRVLDGFSIDTWYAWMPSVFGYPYELQTPDAVQTAILTIAYKMSPARFRELIDRFIDGQNRMREDVYILDRLTPVWDSAIADLLRAKLTDQALRPQAFGRVLSALLGAGDTGAREIAGEVVIGANNVLPGELYKPIQAALELLDTDASSAWKAVWQVAQKNSEFAKRLFSRQATDSYGEQTTKLVQSLREDQLADLYLWISQQEGAFTPDSSVWYWFRIVVMNALVKRGTPEAIQAIRRIDERAPDANLKRVEQAAQEVVRQKTWVPLSPTEFLDLVLCAPPRPRPDGGLLQGPAIPRIADATDVRQFKRNVGVWSLRFNGASASVPHRVGLEYIAHLLRSPDRSLGCLELQGAAAGSRDRAGLLDAADRAHLRTDHPLEDEILDSIGRQKYKDRLKSIEQDLREAASNSDLGRGEGLLGEKQMIIDALKAATGMAGRTRRFAAPEEKARKAVSGAIRNALKMIGKDHPQLAKHLDDRIGRGTVCRYAGDGLEWDT